MTQRTPAMLRGEFGKLHFPLAKGRAGHLLTARWLTEQQQYMPLWSSCDMLYKLQRLFQFAYAPPGSFSLSFCYDHLLNGPQGSSRCGSVGDGMSVTGAHSVRSRNHGVVVVMERSPLGKVTMGT